MNARFRIEAHLIGTASETALEGEIGNAEYRSRRMESVCAADGEIGVRRPLGPGELLDDASDLVSSGCPDAEARSLWRKPMGKSDANFQEPLAQELRGFYADVDDRHAWCVSRFIVNGWLR